VLDQPVHARPGPGHSGDHLTQRVRPLCGGGRTDIGL
jgi:hypothetical protein